MVDVRTLLAAVLGVALGAVMIAAPEFVVQAHTVGRVPGDRRGEYGSDDLETASRYTTLVRVVGVGLVLAGAYFGATLLV